jgi:hypothetical protein
LNPAAIPTRSEVIRSEISRLEISRRIFMPRSMMDSGIRSATPAVPRVSAEDAAPDPSRPPASPLITAEGPTAVGTLLARPGALRRQQRPPTRGGLRHQGRFTVALVSAPRTSAGPLSAIRLSLNRVSVTPRSDLLQTRDSDRTHPCLGARASVLLAASKDLETEGLAAASVGAGTAFEGSDDMATVGGEAFGPATVTGGARAFLEPALAGAGEVGVLAWDGRIGAATGDRVGRSAGILGGTTLIGMRRGRRTTTTGVILMERTTMRRLMIPMLRMTTTRGRAT